MYEIRDVPNFPGYKVDNEGNVFSCWWRGNQYKKPMMTKKWHRLKPGKSSGGYLNVVLSKDNKIYNFFLHKIVLETFVRPRDIENDLVARHLDGNIYNNNLNNLKWGTRKENSDDMRIHGTTAKMKGSKNGMSKLKEYEILEIRKSLENGEKVVDIAKKYNVSQAQIRYIRDRKSWSHI